MIKFLLIALVVGGFILGVFTTYLVALSFAPTDAPVDTVATMTLGTQGYIEEIPDSMRYFTFSLQCNSEYAAPYYGTVWCSAYGFPSMEQIRKLSSSISPDRSDRFIVLSWFEFKSKEDYEDYIRGAKFNRWKKPAIDSLELRLRHPDYPITYEWYNTPNDTTNPYNFIDSLIQIDTLIRRRVHIDSLRIMPIDTAKSWFKNKDFRKPLHKNV